MSFNVNRYTPKKRSWIEVWKIKRKWWSRKCKRQYQELDKKKEYEEKQHENLNENISTDSSEEKKINKFWWVVVIIFCLLSELDREGSHVKHYPTLPMKSFSCYTSNYCVAEGTWDNAHYPNTSKIVCNKATGQCIIETADILFNVLSRSDEEFYIRSWNNSFITADYQNDTYLFRLILNRTTEEVTYTKYPVKKEIMPGWKAEESSFKLIDGYKWQMQMHKRDWEEMKVWQAPILKLLYPLLKPKEEE
nr:MAG TPA: hypothetical protein [Caudoviricetes sp.]